jgi:tetratricopeptide (TPR) repeat protein
MNDAEDYERILQNDSHNLDVSMKLEQIYRERAQWAMLMELLLARVEFPDNTMEQRIELYMEVARICEEKLQDCESAFVLVQAAFREDRTNQAVDHEFERLAERTGKWDEFLTEHTHFVCGGMSLRDQADLWIWVGRIYADHLKNIDYAIAAAQRALELDPNHTQALTNLADYYRKVGKMDESELVLTRRALLKGGTPE